MSTARDEGVRVAVGLPVHNGAAHLVESLESLLGQSYRDFALVLVDNCSTDATSEIAGRYAALDPRLVYERNASQLGMIDNWRRAFELARERLGSFEYYCWGSDHDVWHPSWLEAMVAALDADPALVAAYPVARAIDAEGAPLRVKLRRGDSVGLTDPVRRVRWVGRGLPVRAGNLAYALFRADAVARAGVYPATLEPDRLLVARLSALGPMKQVPRELWTRRFFGSKPTRDRQRARLFTGGVPLHAYVGTWLVHAVALFHWAVVRGAARPEAGRLQGARFAVEYLVLAGLGRANRVLLPRTRKQLRRRWRKARRSLAPRRLAVRAVRPARLQAGRVRRLARRTAARAGRALTRSA